MIAKTMTEVGSVEGGVAAPEICDEARAAWDRYLRAIAALMVHEERKKQATLGDKVGSKGR